MNDLFKFIGDDNSLGYIKGKIYMLELQGRGMYGKVEIILPKRCPYDSWNAFFENWVRADGNTETRYRAECVSRYTDEVSHWLKTEDEAWEWIRIPKSSKQYHNEYFVHIEDWRQYDGVQRI